MRLVKVSDRMSAFLCGLKNCLHHFAYIVFVRVFIIFINSCTFFSRERPALISLIGLSVMLVNILLRFLLPYGKLQTFNLIQLVHRWQWAYPLFIDELLRNHSWGRISHPVLRRWPIRRYNRTRLANLHPLAAPFYESRVFSSVNFWRFLLLRLNKTAESAC